ncbi:hypothetical protein HCDG_04473 [Histoplasma capsulatum H143]|uniref:Uncharacterized protein n=1 Tax=Ajellomyces capsulatus (strain H143) TaxID=544712 RepID=C6HE42_AJECH|nr:hypothetical protein HCDG_04473 [Histoplasma capsulatum H143]
MDDITIPSTSHITMLGIYITNLIILPIALLIIIPLAFTATITISIAFATLFLRLCLVYLDFFTALARAYFHTLPSPPSSTATGAYPSRPHFHTVHDPTHRRSSSQPGTYSPTENLTFRGRIYHRNSHFLLRKGSTPPERKRKLRIQNSQGNPPRMCPLARKHSLPTPVSLGTFVSKGDLGDDFEPINGLFQAPAGVAARPQITPPLSDETGGDGGHGNRDGGDGFDFEDDDDGDDDDTAVADILDY